MSLIKIPIYRSPDGTCCYRDSFCFIAIDCTKINTATIVQKKFVPNVGIATKNSDPLQVVDVVEFSTSGDNIQTLLYKGTIDDLILACDCTVKLKKVKVFPFPKPNGCCTFFDNGCVKVISCDDVIASSLEAKTFVPSIGFRDNWAVPLELRNVTVAQLKNRNDLIIVDLDFDAFIALCSCTNQSSGNQTSYRIETNTGSTVLEEGVTGTIGLTVGSTTITNAIFANTLPLVFRGSIVLSKIDNGVDSFYTQSGSTITLSSPLVLDENILIKQ